MQEIHLPKFLLFIDNTPFCPLANNCDIKDPVFLWIYALFIHSCSNGWHYYRLFTTWTVTHLLNVFW